MTLEQDVLSVVSDALVAAADDHGAVAGAPASVAAVVESVTVTPAGRRRVARIAVDRAVDGPIGADPVPPLGLDEVAEVTRLVSEALDRSDVMGSQPYTLEVTTPGTDRPLTEPIHLRRNVGRVVALTTTGGEVTGRVLATTADDVEVEVAGVKGRPPRRQRIPLADFTKGAVQVEFSRPTSPDTDETQEG